MANDGAKKQEKPVAANIWVSCAKKDAKLAVLDANHAAVKFLTALDANASKKKT